MMTSVSYQQFQSALGDIIICFARAESRFRALVAATAGLSGDAAEIVLDKVSAGNLIKMIRQLGTLGFSEEARSAIDRAAKLYEINGSNRNLFAHGHIGFVGIEGTSFAIRSKNHVGRNVSARGWNIRYDEVVLIPRQIECFDSYAAAVIARIGQERAGDRLTLWPGQPSLPEDLSLRWFDFDDVFEGAREFLSE